MPTATLHIMHPAQWDGLVQGLQARYHQADIWSAVTIPPTMAEVRALHRFAAQTPVQQEKIAVLGFADQFRPEVANALLKLLEEPPAYLQMVLLTESPRVLGTIASRVQLLRPTQAPRNNATAPTEQEAWADLLAGLPVGAAEALLFRMPLLHSTIQQDVVRSGLSGYTE